MFEAAKNALALILFGLASPFGINLGTEEPKYRVIETLSGEVEIRQYDKRIAAEVTIESKSADEARNEGFNLLAGYIFGNNKGKNSIAMTAPVEITAKGEAIAMTSPVETESRAGNMTMRFFMPVSYSMASLPKPTDTRVRLIELPESTVAVLRYSGSTKEQAVTTKTKVLMGALNSSKWKVAGSSKAYFYNPPWTIPILRRNEVMVDVTH